MKLTKKQREILKIGIETSKVKVKVKLIRDLLKRIQHNNKLDRDKIIELLKNELKKKGDNLSMMNETLRGNVSINKFYDKVLGESKKWTY